MESVNVLVISTRMLMEPASLVLLFAQLVKAQKFVTHASQPQLTMSAVEHVHALQKLI